MYWCAHKTATLTSIQHTVPPPGPALNYSEIPYQELYSILVEVICFFNQNLVTLPKTISPFQMDR